MFDLGRRSLRPVATIDQNTSGQPTYCMEFNPKHTNLIAVGNADGSVNIWQLSGELTEQGAKETAMLEQLANEVADWVRFNFVIRKCTAWVFLKHISIFIVYIYMQIFNCTFTL